MSARRVLLPILAGALLLGGCARHARPSEEPKASTLEPGLYRVPTGERLSTAELVEQLRDVRFVLFGERHDSKWQHRRQAELFRMLAGAKGASRALGMEMFQRPFQSALDAYVAGDIDEKQMLERTEWSERWGMDADMYRPLWRTARSRDLPVVALNLRSELSKKIARVGLDGLPDDERAMVPETVDTSIPAQRTDVRRAFEKHDMSAHTEFEHFLEAQAAWDETMAQTAIEFVESRDRIDSLFLVVGRAHARDDFGIPPRIDRRTGRTSPSSTVSIFPLSMSTEHRDAEPTLSTIRSRDVADYVWLGPRRAAQ